MLNKGTHSSKALSNIIPVFFLMHWSEILNQRAVKVRPTPNPKTNLFQIITSRYPLSSLADWAHTLVFLSYLKTIWKVWQKQLCNHSGKPEAEASVAEKSWDTWNSGKTVRAAPTLRQRTDTAKVGNHRRLQTWRGARGTAALGGPTGASGSQPGKPTAALASSLTALIPPSRFRQLATSIPREYRSEGQRPGQFQDGQRHPQPEGWQSRQLCLAGSPFSSTSWKRTRHTYPKSAGWILIYLCTKMPRN